MQGEVRLALIPELRTIPTNKTNENELTTEARRHSLPPVMPYAWRGDAGSSSHLAKQR